MREILFRGKRQDNGKWIEGSFVKYTDYDGDEVYLIYASNGNPNNIIPETVGQFTGLTDKNGKKIFEGDIVKWDEKEWGRLYNELVEFDYELLTMRKHDYKQWCEVIGNIHDNKELLG